MKIIKSYANVNLFLKVLKLLKKYHQLYSLITQVNLYDEIYIKETNDKKTNLFFSGKFKISNKNNTIIHLLNLMKKKFPILKSKNFDIYIKKNIPLGSGFGGASSNATSIFNFLKKKYKLKISHKASLKFLSDIGKDCPLFINQRVKLLNSSGENFKEFVNKPKLEMLLIYPNYKLSTKKVFERITNISNISKKKIDLNKRENLLQICRIYGNDLLKPAIRINSKLSKTIKLINKISI